MSFAENKTKYLIIFTVALDVIGMGIIMPVLPEFVNVFHASYLQTTMLVSVYAFCSFLSAPFLGAISDRYGRKLVLVTSIFGTALGWFVVGFAPTLLFVFIGRIIDGVTAGNMVIAQTILGDIAKDEKERIANYGIF
jgi:MFS family permease